MKYAIFVLIFSIVTVLTAVYGNNYFQAGFFATFALPFIYVIINVIKQMEKDTWQFDLIPISWCLGIIAVIAIHIFKILS